MKHFLVLALLLSGLIFSSRAEAQAWQQTNGPGGTVIQSVAVNSQGHIFVASDAIMRSTDGGNSWMRIATELSGFGNYDWTVIIKAHPNGDLFLSVTTDSSRSGIWRSTDNGTSWIRVMKGIFLTMNITPDGSVFALDNSSAIRSIDNGSTWTNVAKNNITSLHNIWGDKAGHFFLDADFLYRSTDNGQNWSKIINGITTALQTFIEMPNGDLFGSSYSDIFQSIDGGRTWKVVTPKFNDTYYLSNPVILSVNSQGRIAVASTGANWPGLLSTDEGQSWHFIYYPSFYPSDNNFAILTSDNNGNFYGTYQSASGTLFKSPLIDSSSVWTHIDVPTGSVTAISMHQNGNLVAFTQDNQYNRGWIWISSNGGMSWVTIRNDTAMNINFDGNTTIYATAVDSSHNIFAGTNGYIILSNDGGATWKRNSSQLTTGEITGIDVRNTGEIFASSSTEGIFRSSDNGLSWDQLNTGIKNQSIFSLAVHQNGDVYAGSQNIIYKSTDVGLTWTQLTTNFPKTAGNVSTLVVSTQGNIIAGVDNAGVFWSTDNGTTWSLKALGLTATKINALVSTPSGKVFAATNSGIFFLDIIPGANWLKFNSGLTATNVLSLCRDQNGRIFAGTDVSGVFSSINTFNVAHPNGSLTTPTLTAPANGSTVAKGNVQLVWNIVANALSYQVTISKTSDFSTVEVLSDYLLTNSFSLAINDSNTTYYWHVQAIGADGASLYSDNWSFGTSNAGVDNNNSFISSLGTNYPNPFSSSTTIPFSIGERSYITLEVFDPLGRSKAILANGNYEAGSYNVKFAAENLSAGIYFVRLRTEKESFTKTLEILK
jgi:photosystem II stability/assembly factor-like uncharacterized protein